MQIKRVVVHGFKTFARKTEFIFDPGITAIVGPNGSGKSNVVDAVRWCLGEQSFSQLRSKKTSDVIFAGSDKRSRMGMAQVSITLDNNSGELPVEFAEVEITRRAYRDGDNDYLINNKRVRLQDVTELLAHTGLGKRSYAVIGQGLIDKILSLSPEERRSLFEEAAGIANYRQKRTTTLRRLDATQQNLERVHDIVSELSPRLSYLKRQADRARQREEIASELREALQQWYGYRWHNTLQNLHRYIAQEQGLNQQVQKKRRALTAIGQRIDTFRTEQSTLRTNLSHLHQQSGGLHQEAEKVGRALAIAQERLRQSRERKEESERELAPLRVQSKTLAERIVDLAAVIQSAQVDYTQKNQAVQQAQRELGQYEEERKRRQQILNAVRQQANDLQSRIAGNRSRLSQSEERYSSLKQEHERQSEAQQVAEQDVARLSGQVGQAESEVEISEKQLHILQAEIVQKQSLMDALNQQIAQVERERQEADRLLDRLQTRQDLLQRLHDEGEGYASGVRAILQAATRPPSTHPQSKAHSQPLPGILGTIATLIQVPAELDKAIETALGGAFQNIVAERWEDARQAIDFLKQNGRGRATFLPLDRLNVLPTIKAPNIQGILGNAALLVAYDQRVEAAVQQLLNRVWVAQDLQSSRHALDTIRHGSRPTVVTLLGEIVRPGGAVTGGSDNQRRDNALFARERELRALPQQIQEATKAVERIVEARFTLSTRKEKLQIELQSQQQALAEQNQQERHQRQALEGTRRELDRAKQAFQWQSERLVQIDQEVAKLAGQETALLELITELQEAEIEAKKRLTQAEADVAEVGAEQLLQQLADLRAAAAEAQGHLRSQQTILENQKRNQQSTQDQIQGKERQIVTFAQEANSLSQQTGELGQQEAALGQQLSQFRQQIAPIEVELTALEKAQRQEEGKEREEQSALRQSEADWNAAQLQLQRTEDALYQLHEGIEQELVEVEEKGEDEAEDKIEEEAEAQVEIEQGGQENIEVGEEEKSATSAQSADQSSSDRLTFWREIGDSFAEFLPVVESIPDNFEAEVKRQRNRLSRVANVNPDAPREYEEAAGRHESMITQSADLEESIRNLRKIIKELDELMESELSRTFEAVANEFGYFFQKLFNGGTAKLVLTTPEDVNNTGVEIIARPPGKRPQSLALLSGGERSLSACALIFSILRVSPTPFSILDEVDAALDEANVDRFRETVQELCQDTQFIIITHNRRTLEGANTIYGVTMGDDGVSQVISLRLEDEKLEKVNDGEAHDEKMNNLHTNGAANGHGAVNEISLEGDRGIM